MIPKTISRLIFICALITVTIIWISEPFAARRQAADSGDYDDDYDHKRRPDRGHSGDVKCSTQDKSDYGCFKVIGSTGVPYYVTSP